MPASDIVFVPMALLLSHQIGQTPCKELVNRPKRLRGTLALHHLLPLQDLKVQEVCIYILFRRAVPVAH